MNIRTISFLPSVYAKSMRVLLLCGCMLFTACVGNDKDATPKSGSQNPPKAGSQSTTKQLGYGVSISPLPSWEIVSSLSGNTANKENLDKRRTSGERILLVDMKGPTSPKGLDPRVGIFLVNQDGTFMPREFAETLTPEKFAAMNEQLLKDEKALAKKKKVKSNVLDIKVSSDTIGGNFAIKQNITISAANNEPVKLMQWDIYLPNGAGIAVKTVADPSAPNMENDILAIVKTLTVN